MVQTNVQIGYYYYWILDILAPAITDILNCSFRNCTVPQAWKMADVSPILKTSNKTDFNQALRPISLTSTLYHKSRKGL